MKTTFYRTFVGAGFFLHKAFLVLLAAVVAAIFFVLAGPPAEAQTSISFQKGVLQGEISTNPTSLQFGPDGRLYVAQQNGLINAYTIERSGAGSYAVTATQTINLVKNIPNHNDNGTLNTSQTNRQVTGMLVAGTAANPIIYVGSSDPRIGAGSSGTDSNLDTNSGIVSRLTWNGTSWNKVDLVRGLPRSEENHSVNGMQLDEATNTLYLAVGGNTNKGAPSNNFALLPEYALSAAILKIDLNAIGNTTYDLPTLDDEDRAGSPDSNDPFGGNDGKNQAKLVPGGPVQVYASGFRNPYDLVIAKSGKMYTIDNGGNAGWGDIPVNEGPGGTCTNQVNEPGTTDVDSLHYITGAGYYGGHPNPTRGNKANTFNASNPQSPVSTANAVECDYRANGAEKGSLATFTSSTNGLAEYTASNFGGAMKGDLLTASYDNNIYRVKLNAAGDAVVSKEVLFSSVDTVGTPLDVIAQGDAGLFAGTVWSANYGNDEIIVFEPIDDGQSCNATYDPNLDSDGDLFDNADEIDNATDPCSPADFPPDNDGDKWSDLNDPDDDNDTLPDTSDPFAVDKDNGKTKNLPVSYTWDNDAPPAGGLLNLGFTGLMTNKTTDYKSLYNPINMTAGGAAGAVTVDKVPAGDAFGTTNSQQYGFQFGVNATATTGKFTARTRIMAPFAGLTPQDYQSMGLFIGNGDQDNYVKLVTNANKGSGGIEYSKEVNGTFTRMALPTVTMPGPDAVDLFLTVDPAANTVQASYQIITNDVAGARTNVGTPKSIPAEWFGGTTGFAVGIISTSNGPGPEFPATWGFIEVKPGTIDTFAPTVSSVVPQDGATAVALSANAEATFSEKMDASTINASTFTLTEQGTTTPVNAAVSYDATTKMATLNPDADLKTATTYTATVKGGTNGVKDLSGNPLANDKVWTFTTAAPADTTPPETTIDSGPSGKVNSGSATFTFSSSEAGSTFACSLDSAAFSACSSPQSYSGLSDGQHTFEVRATDAANNTDATPATQNWTVDTTAPTVTNVAPQDGAMGVAVSVNAEATFSEKMDASTINASTFTLTEQGTTTPINAAVSYDATTEKAMLNPDANLEASATYTAMVTTGVKDAAGNALATDKVWSFTTAASADTTPPETTIDSGPTGAVSNASATFTFSSNETGSTFACSLDGAAFASCSSPKDYTGLADGQHTFEVRATDSANNTDATPATQNWSVDTTAPTVGAVAPADGANDVAVGANVEATFSEAVDKTSVEVNGTFELTEQGSSNPVSAAVSYDATTKMATLNPSADLKAATTYTAIVKGGTNGVKDLSGNLLANDKVWTFTTAASADTTPPETTIDSGPSGTVNSASATFTFSSNEAGSTFACSLDSAAFSACSSPQSYSGLSDGQHTFEVRATDAANNTDATPATQNWTVDTTAPTVTSAVPAAEATEVAVTTNVEATFSEAMDAATINGTTFTLLKQGAPTPVAATITYDPEKKKAVLDPSSGLEEGTTYTATVRGEAGGVRDLAGNALAADKTWSFTTAAVAAPSNLAAVRKGTGTTQRIDLTWLDNSKVEAKFVIERSTTSNFTSNLVTYEVGANVQSYSDTALQRKTKYYYRVFAVDLTEIRSAPSNVVSVNTK